jgi:hypothetical protein
VAWQQDLIEYLKRYESITIKEASQFWSKTERTASTRLKKMLDTGLVFEVGTGPYDPKKKFVLANK